LKVEREKRTGSFGKPINFSSIFKISRLHRKKARKIKEIVPI
jgi:hypothetical protein